MANKKRQSIKLNDFETPFLEDMLKKLPLGFRFMDRQETESIGELHLHRRFSKSVQHGANQYKNYPCYKSLSNALIHP
jgi:hypothetical protein